MNQISIPAEVVNGHLQHDRNLSLWEGQRVLATLTLLPKDAPEGQEAKDEPPEPSAEAEFDPEPPPWLEVEQDVYFPMTVPAISLGKVTIRTEKGRPSIILPEELPDD
jgi:hypothetical protein